VCCLKGHKYYPPGKTLLTILYIQFDKMVEMMHNQFLQLKETKKTMIETRKTGRDLISDIEEN